MKSFLKICSILLLTILFLTGCEKNPSAPVEKKQSQIKIGVVIQDELGRPYGGVEVTFYPDNIKGVTDQSGRAYFEINPGNYQIIVNNPNIPLFYKDVFFDKNQNMDIKFIVATKVNITVAIKDPQGNPIRGLEVSTFPTTFKVDTNYNGLAIFENVPVRSYIFIISRGNFSLQTPDQKLIVKNGLLEDVVITLGSQKPAIKILYPTNRVTQNIFNIKLEGFASDFEDGDLPDEALTWYSNIDGELGHGKTLIVDRMSVGNHIISLTAVDSDGNSDVRSTDLNLFYYDPLSFFPIPFGGQWEYQYNPPKINIINENHVQEEWDLRNLKVEMTDVSCRKSSMNYFIKTPKGEKTCEYWIKDYYETDVENIYVSKTEEYLQFWLTNSSGYDKPDQIMHIITEYAPKYMVVKNHENILEAGNFNSTVSADITWYFDDIDYGSKTYHELMDVSTRVEVGGYENVDTGIGILEAVKYIITQGQSTRTWWLSKSYGMVRLEFESLGTPLTCTLSRSNIGGFLEGGAGGVIAGKRTGYYGNPVNISMESKPGTPERSLEICKMLKNLVPR